MTGVIKYRSWNSCGLLVHSIHTIIRLVTTEFRPHPFSQTPLMTFDLTFLKN